MAYGGGWGDNNAGGDNGWGNDAGAAAGGGWGDDAGGGWANDGGADHNAGWGDDTAADGGWGDDAVNDGGNQQNRVEDNADAGWGGGGDAGWKDDAGGGGWEKKDAGGGGDDGWGDDGDGGGGDAGDAGWGDEPKNDGDEAWGNDDGDVKAEKVDTYDMSAIEIAQIDWEKEELDDAHGYNYEEHEAIQELTEEDVTAWRNSWHMDVESSDKSLPIPKPIRSFEESKFPEDILQLIDSSRGGDFDNPTPIQSQGWPLIMTGKDVIGVAQTGSGKTLAFILPGVMHIRLNTHQRENCPTAMVQAPTRELARQIADETKKYGQSIKVGHSFGGEGRRSQEYALKTAQMVIGTPGRTMDHLSRDVINLRYCTYVVLDEADRMLDMGFQPQVEKIFRCVRPTGRQLLMFTATWPYAVHELAAKLFKLNWLKVTIGALQTSANHNVVQKFLFLNSQYEKQDKLAELLTGEFKGKKSLVFVKTRVMADEVCMQLRGKRISTAALHGGKDQAMRDLIVRDFKLGEHLRCLIATDVAQRGLHVEDISLVVNFDFPNNIEDYVHRIGRTARQGRKGTSITMFNMRMDGKHIEDLVKVLEEAKQIVPKEFKDGNQYGGGGYDGGGGGYGGGGGGGVCYSYQKGTCTRGDACRFSHEDAGGDGGGGGAWADSGGGWGDGGGGGW